MKCTSQQSWSGALQRCGRRRESPPLGECAPAPLRFGARPRRKHWRGHAEPCSPQEWTTLYSLLRASWVTLALRLCSMLWRHPRKNMMARNFILYQKRGSMLVVLLCRFYSWSWQSHLMRMKCNSARYLDLGACYKEPQAVVSINPSFRNAWCSFRNTTAFF